MVRGVYAAHFYVLFLHRRECLDKREMTEAAISIISQLCLMSTQSKDLAYVTRLIAKLSEEAHEKLQRCCELFVNYKDILSNTERDIIESSVRRDINRERGVLDEDEDIDYDSEEMRYSKVILY